MNEKITMCKKNNLTVKDANELFMRCCKIKNLTDQTIHDYSQKLSLFYRFISDDTLLTKISKDTVDDYIICLCENYKCNDISINSYLCDVRIFLYYCMECNYIPHFKIRLIKADKKVKETYSDSDLRKLLEKPDTNSCSFSTYKTWVFENYLLATGNRISSALNVRIDDINFEDGLITLRKTKNRKQQIIPLSHTLSEILTEYLEVRGGETEDYLFCNEYGNKAIVRTYQQLVRRYNIKRGVNITSCHAFRHTFAKHCVMAGMDCFRLQRILGHSDLTVTREYVAMFSTDLQIDFEKYNPLDNLNKPKTTIKMG